MIIIIIILPLQSTHLFGDLGVLIEVLPATTRCCSLPRQFGGPRRTTSHTRAAGRGRGEEGRGGGGGGGGGGGS